jgi:hypothetical protein
MIVQIDNRARRASVDAGRPLGGFVEPINTPRFAARVWLGGSTFAPPVDEAARNPPSFKGHASPGAGGR